MGTGGGGGGRGRAGPAPAGQRIVSAGQVPVGDLRAIEDDSKNWGADRGTIVTGAVRSIINLGHDGRVAYDGDRPVGIISFSRSTGNIPVTTVGFMASHQDAAPGTGRTLLQRAAMDAVFNGTGLHLHAADQARGFYEKMGMTPGAGALFAFTRDQAKEFATS